ncbi:MAG: hypothetical protein ACXW6R_20615, partial [Candidatus Binatia bacterium]
EASMKNYLSITNTAAVVALAFGINACSSQEEMVAKPAPKPAAPAAKAEAKAEVKAPAAKATKIAGDIGLLDTEKNYLIVVTKEGKLVTVDYDTKFQPTMRTPKPSKVADIGLGSSATVTYTKEGDKNIATNVEYLPAKGE